MNVSFNRVIKVEENRKSSNDRRKRVDWILCSYDIIGKSREDLKGALPEWRVAFEVPVGTSQRKLGYIPQQGDSKDILALQYRL